MYHDNSRKFHNCLLIRGLLALKNIFYGMIERRLKVFKRKHYNYLYEVIIFHGFI